jgi:hypothetical protein
LFALYLNSITKGVLLSGSLCAFPLVTSAATSSLYFFPCLAWLTFWSCSCVRLIPNPNYLDTNADIITPIPSSFGMIAFWPLGVVQAFVVEQPALLHDSFILTKTNNGLLSAGLQAFGCSNCLQILWSSSFCLGMSVMIINVKLNHCYLRFRIHIVIAMHQLIPSSSSNFSFSVSSILIQCSASSFHIQSTVSQISFCLHST